MSTFKVGDKVMYEGREHAIDSGPWFFYSGGEFHWGLKRHGVVAASLLTPAAPPKLGAVWVRVQVGGCPTNDETKWVARPIWHAWNDGSLNNDNYRFVRADLDLLDADKRRADAAERRAQQYAADLGAANKRIAELEAMSFNQRAELDRLRAAPADLVPLDELWEKHGVYIGKYETVTKIRSGWAFYNHEDDLLWERGIHPTHAAAWKAASEWAKQQKSAND